MFFKRKPKLKYYIADQSFVDGRVVIVEEPKWDSGFKSILKDNNATHIRFSWSAGWREENYSFLEELSDFGLEGLGICTYDKVDLSPIRDLRDLKILSFNQGYYSNCPDFSEFKNLKCLKFDYQPTARSVFKCVGLETLYLFRYPHENLLPISHMSHLKRLVISGSKIKSLKGIDQLSELDVLDIHYGKNLGSLDYVEQCSKLRAVTLFRCGDVAKNNDFKGIVDNRKGMN